MLNFDWLTGLPIATARLIFLGLYMIIAGLIWCVPRAYVYHAVEEPKWWHNLKLWATGILGLMTLCYIML